MRSTLVIATLFAAALSTLGSCVSPEAHRRALGANDALKAEITSLTATQHAIALENEKLRSELDRLGKQAADADWIREQKDKLDKLLQQYQSGGASAVDGVELVRTSEGLAFRVLGGVLFRSGSIEISEQGKATLAKLIPTLKNEGKRVRVDGHTDDEQLTKTKGRWGTNLRLSAERSLAVAEFLTQSGLAADQVGIGGYGEHRPAVAGSTEDARRQNRRVEILMLDR